MLAPLPPGPGWGESLLGVREASQWRGHQGYECGEQGTFCPWGVLDLLTY